MCGASRARIRRKSELTLQARLASADVGWRREQVELEATSDRGSVLQRVFPLGSLSWDQGSSVNNLILSVVRL